MDYWHVLMGFIINENQIILRVYYIKIENIYAPTVPRRLEIDKLRSLNPDQPSNQETDT